MKTIMFVVPGNFDVDCAMLVKATLRDNRINIGNIRKHLTAAITEWICKQSKAAVAAWKYAGDGFNIGDLSCHQDDKSLRACLRKQGIIELEIFSHDEVDWNHDSNLVNGEKVQITLEIDKLI